MKRFLLWDYPRACWQYDVMVGIILAFVFLTPRELFRDQPRASSSVVMLPAGENSSVFWVEPELLSNIGETERPAKVAEVLRHRTGGKKRDLIRLEPIFDAEQELKGYMAFTRP
jgi:hypothetical protein